MSTNDTFLKFLPMCARCGDIIGRGGPREPSGSVVFHFRFPSGYTGKARDYHRKCAPLIGGKLPPAATINIVPYPAVRNVREACDQGVIWTMYRVAGDSEHKYRVVLDPLMLKLDRDHCARLLWRARRQLRAAVARGTA